MARSYTGEKACFTPMFAGKTMRATAYYDTQLDLEMLVFPACLKLKESAMSDLAAQQVFLGRQPILDRHQQLFAYELLFRDSHIENGNVASFSDGNQATATVISNTFAELSMADVLGNYRGFIKVDQGLLFSDMITALPPHAVVLEILETSMPSAETVARCEQLRQSGFSLAVRERLDLPDQDRSLHKLARFIKIDISQASPGKLGNLLPDLKPLGKTLIAEKVEQNEQMQLCNTLGFDLFQGYYFARPTVIQGRSLQTSELSLLRLLALLSQDADSSEIEKLLKQEPVLTMNLLRLTNSAGSGVSTRITSLRHAITLLGRRQLSRWLQLLIYSGRSGNTKTVNPLLQLAATRGRLMELLADRPHGGVSSNRELLDQAYMVGILSLMPALLRVQMADILKHLPVATPIFEALGEHKGLLGDLLSLVELLEDTRSESDNSRIQGILERFPTIDSAYANNCLARALTWANSLVRESN